MDLQLGRPSVRLERSMQGLEGFEGFVRPNELLAPYTYLKVGGPAEALAQPRSREELAAIVKRCFQKGIPLRALGGGSNILVRDEGVRGVVLRLSEPAFTEVSVEGRKVRAGTGARLSALISQSARHNLSGLELLIGIPGTVGGAVRRNAGDRSGEIGQYVRQVEVLDDEGQLQARDRDELRFAYRWSNLDEPVLLAAEFELEADTTDAIVKRMRKAWIERRAAQPLSYQAALRAFMDPRGTSASTLIEEAGLRQTRVGGAEISDRDANYIVAHPGATARDILHLIDLVRSRVRERFNIELELQITIW
jgi:UDP-N-acetylmuramate dehydrogenase